MKGAEGGLEARLVSIKTEQRGWVVEGGEGTANLKRANAGSKVLMVGNSGLLKREAHRLKLLSIPILQIAVEEIVVEEVEVCVGGVIWCNETGLFLEGVLPIEAFSG